MARKSGFSVVLVIVLLLLVAICGVGAMCYLSVTRIIGHTDQANADYQAFETSFEDGDYDSAMASLESLCAEWRAVDDEANSWQWQVASYVPVLGEDVTSLQNMASIARRLSNDGVLPMASEAKGILDGLSSTSSLTDLAQSAGQIGQFVQTLDTCRKVVSQCRFEAEAVPQAHLDVVNDVRTQLIDQATQVDEAFGKIDALLDLANLTGLTS